MAEDEVHGTRLTPNAVGPGTFNEYMHGMQRGSGGGWTATQPSTQPATQSATDPVVTVPWSLPHRDAPPPSAQPDASGNIVPIAIPVPVNSNGQP